MSFTQLNWILLGLALGVIAVGYMLLRVPAADGVLSLTVAPLFLVLGYCVLVPAAILVRGRTE